MHQTIDVGKVFYHRLANRDKFQGDGKHNAIQFREKYLKLLDDPNFWKSPTLTVVLDFSNVRKIGPSFANEAFAYFTKYAKPEQILIAIKIEKATNVQGTIIREELELGYKGK